MSKTDPNQKRKRVAVLMSLHYALPWHHEPYQGIRRYADRQGWECVVDPHMFEIDGGLDASAYDGVIGRITTEVADVVVPAGVPIVTLTYNVNYLNLPGVRLDSREAGRMSAEHLLASGYRRLGIIGLEGTASASLFTKGMGQALEAFGLPALEALTIPNDFDEAVGLNAQIRQMMSDWLLSLTRPVGVLVATAAASRYLAVIAQNIGLRVPEDVGIVVAAGDQVIMTSNSPTLSSIEEDFYKQGYEAAALLDELMQGRPVSPLRRTLPPKRVIVRESSDVFLCDDPLVSQAMHAIAERAHNNLSVDELADLVNSSRRTLERRFEEVLTRSVHAEIRRLRTEYIQRLLSETDRTIGNIALSCDFDSASHFARFFKRETGLTPSAYRKLHRE